MVTAATAAAKTTVLALVAGLMAALRVSADRRSGTSEGVANTTKADELGTIEVRVVVDFLTASNATNMRFRNETLLFFSLSLSPPLSPLLDFF